MTLTSRIVALVLLVLVPAIAVQSFNEHALRSAREDAVTASALRSARAVSEDLAQFAAGMSQLLDILAEAPFIRDQEAAGCTSFLRSIISKLSGATILILADAEGHLVCNSRGMERGAYSMADRTYFQKAMVSGLPVIGEYVVGRGSGVPTIQFAYPIQASGAKSSGLLIFGFDPAWLGDRLAHAGLPKDATVTVLDRSGTIIVQTPDTGSWVGRDMPAAFATGLSEAEAAGGVIEMPDLGGTPRITGMVRPDGALDGMTLAVGLSRDTAFADIDAATRRGVILIFLGTLVAIVAALIGGRVFIRKPVRRLLKASRAWRSGQLSARSGLTGSSEFGQLGQAFDAMAVALERHEDGLRAELERTRSLQEQQVTMMHELNHRVKNTLATVQSLARQSRGGEEQAAQLEGRILALSKTHDLLTRDDWTGAPLRAVLENELSPYRSSADHMELDGPDIDLPPRYVLALGMTAHELTTNAAKYGALSGRQGRLSVVWRVVEDGVGARRLEIEWQERGGPVVAQPKRRGFGTRLITGGIARELAGSVQLDFLAEGLRCRIDVPIETVPMARFH
ncbi:sensor histidine kinase [Methylobacterium sp. 77]|uniref:sensor histidine kinase n=1 Tax=Methylobacterium sp. 77 TaxID=1101192 RepID=UPI00035FF732|nr:sensor histidine kinase [Methylobacterium sp. 77]